MDNRVYGINAVREYARSGRVLKFYRAERLSGNPLIKELEAQGVSFEIANDRKLSALANSDHHQGIVADVKPLAYASLDHLLKRAKEEDHPIILMLDGIKDPHNFGAILRSCDAFGACGVIIKKKNAVPLNETVARVSTGAINYVDVVAVANLSQAIKELQSNGFWVVSTDGSAKMSIHEPDYDFPVCLVVGSEGEGVSRLVLEHSDFIVKIPMRGHVNSLNASVSCGIALASIRAIQK